MHADPDDTHPWGAANRIGLQNESTARPRSRVPVLVCALVGVAVAVAALGSEMPYTGGLTENGGVRPIITAVKRLSATLLIALSTLEQPARADLPPPAGQARVHYEFQVEAIPSGVTVLAFPLYNFENNALYVPMGSGKNVGTMQGYTPGIYALSQEDAAGLPKQDEQATRDYLARKARLCLKQVPRLFTVPTATKIEHVIDVLQITLTPQGCSAKLAKTIYEGPKGMRGEGRIDEAGRRLPPPPFGRDLPDVLQAGFAGLSATATATATHPPVAPPTTGTPSAEISSTKPVRSGCAGCAMSQSSAHHGAAVLFPVLLAGWRARRRSFADKGAAHQGPGRARAD